MTETNSKAKSCLMGCGIAAIMPVALIIIFAAILVINNRPPSIVIPSNQVPKDNAWDDYKMAAIMASKAPAPATEAPESSLTIQQLEKPSKANAPMLAVIRRGLSKECMCPSERDRNVMFPELVGFRTMAKAFRAEAYYYQRSGDNARAADSLLDGVEFGVTVPRGGVLITHLVGIACEAIGTRDLPEFIQKLDKQQLAHVAKRLEVIQTRRWPYREIILEEGRFTASNLSQMCTDPKERSKVVNPRNWVEPSPFDPYFGLSGTAPTLKERLQFVGQNVRYAFTNKARFIRQVDAYFKAVAAEQSKPYTGTSKIKVPSDLIYDICYIEFGRARASSCKAEAKLALLQADVAVRRYFADIGRYPANLNQLVPKYLKAAPVDPFGNGKSVRYLQPKGARSFVIYSVGVNLTDDGGAPGKWRGTPTGGDLVLGKGD